MTTLRSQPLRGEVDAHFFVSLASYKLDVAKLESNAKTLVAHYRTPLRNNEPPALSVTAAALDDTAPPPDAALSCRAPGLLVNTNTLDEFKERDKAALLAESARLVHDDIASGAAWEEPSRLARFLLFTFADLKTHHFYYWFAVPAFAHAPPPVAPPPRRLEAVLGVEAAAALAQSHAGYARVAGASARGYFAVRLEGGAPTVVPLARWRQWAAAPDGSEMWLAFCDPAPNEEAPGWPIRNLLSLAAAALPPPSSASGDPATVRVLAYRGSASSAPPSLVFDVSLVPTPAPSLAAPPAAVGWERSASGGAGARMMDLSAHLDPAALATSSVELNLRLMKWRLMPSLDTERVAQTRCLLLGAGTLGCAVARVLLGWGVRHITLVDSGRVSYSNPVRQCLFEHADCVDGATLKAPAAAEALRKIYPGVEAKGVVLSIPMPGHAVTPTEVAAVSTDVARLGELIGSHDVVFLLTDTRESRWLPTLQAVHAGKPCLTAALGFDSFLVMRHGRALGADGGATVTDDDAAGARLGCYFCNDVVAPTNSMRRRTLDQQCTVSRPGLAMVASALAVELMVTLLHHPERFDAGATSGGTAGDSPLGNVPHQVRGTLPFFRTDCMTGHASDRCTACSASVVQAYRERGIDLCLDAFNQPNFLEALSGLDQVHLAAEAAIAVMQLDDGLDDAELDDF